MTSNLNVIIPELTCERMYRAILEKDSSFEGVFFTCVKTTGIFCRPACTARKPKRENVEFVASVREAIAKGYRPCKVCEPLKKFNETPAYIQALIEEIQNSPSQKITDKVLRKRKLEPDTIRRWFLKNHGITFHAFQRMYRINTAFKRLQNGEPVTSTAFNSGFESLSGFGDSFKSVFGVSPKQGKTQQVINVMRLETPLGTMLACTTEKGICLLEFTDRKMLETELKDLVKRLNAVLLQGDNKHFNTLRQQLAEYFDGRRKEFTIPLDTPGTDFQQSVWDILRTIPYGTTRSYLQQANLLRKPESVRAVAHANGMNRISIVIPCHRVIGTNGKLVGYSGGLWRKQWLLNFERGHNT